MRHCLAQLQLRVWPSAAPLPFPIAFSYRRVPFYNLHLLARKHCRLKLNGSSKLLLKNAAKNMHVCLAHARRVQGHAFIRIRRLGNSGNGYVAEARD